VVSREVSFMINRLVSGITQAVFGLFPQREEGQGMVEYGLILSFVALIVVGSLIVMGPKLKSYLSSITTSI
jgi:Flp pilus assembly pilin Flp